MPLDCVVARSADVGIGGGEPFRSWWNEARNAPGGVKERGETKDDKKADWTKQNRKNRRRIEEDAVEKTK